MNTDELQAVVNQLKDIREASNWSGKFNIEIRAATIDYRQTKLALPLDEVLSKLEAELAKRRRKRRKGRVHAPEYRAPYPD